MIKVISRVHLIGSAPVASQQRKGRKASLSAEKSADRRVSVQTSATNAWNQNWNASNPGNQNNNTKTNSRRVRAVRRPEATDNA